MRKYQQLLLLAISVLSIVTLLLYRSENGRLKYVLDVVNMLGKANDRHPSASAATSADLSFEYTTPFPIWQRIGKGFHAYAAFWHWDHSEPGVGEVTAIVVGLQHAIVSFRCDVRLTPAANGTNGNQQTTVLAGRFGFNREEMPATDLDNAIHAADQTANGGGDAYIVYKFICRVTKVPYDRPPQRVTFAELTGGGSAKHQLQEHSLGVRVLAATRPTHRQHGLVACVNLISPLPAAVHRYFYAGDAVADASLLAYFYHQQLVGVDEFIVYDRSDRIGLTIKRALAVHGVRVNYLPFNFPFAASGPTSANDPKVRHILQLDCELRTLNVSRWFVLAQPNEMLYASEALQSAENSTLQRLAAGGAMRVQLTTNTVCLNATTAPATAAGRAMIDENLYVAAAADVVRSAAGPAEGAVVLARATLNRAVGDAAVVLVPAVRVLANRYVECRPMDRNTEVTHNTWPATIEAHAARKVMEFGGSIRREVVRMLGV